jgi:type II secretory pathway component PulJ
MKKREAFTLVEVLISLFISSFIIFGMLQLYRNLQTFIDKSYQSMKFNRKTYILFNQLEKDFSTSFMPKIDKSEKKDNKQKEITLFRGDIYFNEYKKIKGSSKRLELFKKVVMVNTNPLTIYNENAAKLVRVGYFIQKNKELSKGQNRVVYDLYRKETNKIENEEFKKDEKGKKDKQDIYVKEFLVAQNIKHLSIEYYGFEKETEKNKDKIKKNKKPKMISDFIWGKEKETQNVLPKKIIVNISFWDEGFVSDSSFSCQINIFTQESKEDNKQAQIKDGENKTKEEKAEGDGKK